MYLYGGLFRVYSSGMESPLSRIHIHIHKHHGESLRVDVPRDLSPADPVKKLKDSETENCIRRLTRAVPGGSPRGGNVTSKIRNLNSNTHMRRSLLLFVWSCASHEIGTSFWSTARLARGETRRRMPINIGALYIDDRVSSCVPSSILIWYEIFTKREKKERKYNSFISYIIASI